jgi:naringenin degradation protein FdeH
MGTVARRIVTGHNAEGKSIFVADGPCPHHFDRGNGNALTELWWSDKMPVDNSGNADCGAPAFGLDMPPSGHIFRIVEYAPDAVREAAMKASGAPSRHYIDGRRHFGFHKTDTIDYAIVLEGEIYALMDEGEKLMRPGDVLIQRGTAHAWSNRTDKPARVAFILIDATPAP